MKKLGLRPLVLGVSLIIAFILWTFLVKTIDVKLSPITSTPIGFATLNLWFHNLTGVYMTLYTITDWLGLVPICVCLIFGGIGLSQWIKRKCLFHVDYDIIILGGYYIVIVACYLLFEYITINYRPIFINGYLESSYPSSTTLLVFSVMPALSFYVNHHICRPLTKNLMRGLTNLFIAFMILARLISGVHWLTDIIGSVLLCGGLFFMYKGIILLLKDQSTSFNTLPMTKRTGFRSNSATQLYYS